MKRGLKWLEIHVILLVTTKHEFGQLTQLVSCLNGYARAIKPSKIAGFKNYLVTGFSANTIF